MVTINIASLPTRIVVSPRIWTWHSAASRCGTPAGSCHSHDVAQFCSSSEFNVLKPRACAPCMTARLTLCATPDLNPSPDFRPDIHSHAGR